MGVIGQAFTPVPPTVSVTAGPQWATDVNAVLAEAITRLAAVIDSTSILLTTGDVKHATRTGQLGAADGQSGGATWTKGTGATAAYWLGAAAGDTVEVVLPLERNQRLTRIRMTGRSVGTAWTFRVWRIDTATGARTQIGTTKTSAALTTIEELTSDAMTETVADGVHYIAEWTAGAALTRFIGIEYDYDRQVAT